ncbi:MAG: glycosyltransferase family 4 protein [Chloroflexi bacterium]|nr:glycosyltransferase family 4 protein [Chloroflexota bacterium]
MRKFRVLLVVPLGGVGGTELSTLSLASGLKQAGHQVYVMCNNHPLVDEFRARGLEVVPAGMKRNAIGLARDAAIMRRCIDENGIDIIHFQSAFPIIMSLLCWRTIKASRAKVIWTCRGIKRTSYPVVGRLFNVLTDFVIANCRAERDRLIRHGLSPDKVTAIYNCPTIGIPEDTGTKSKELLDELGIEPRVPVIGTASRLAPERGVRHFIQAAALICDRMPGVKFVIAGGGPSEKELRRQVRDLSMEQQVIFLGPRRDMESVYSIMDVFVNPSLVRCGTDNVSIEAMAFAKPVVITDVGGGAEVVHQGVTGFVVSPRDSGALAQAVLHLLRDPDLAKQMGLAGRERILNDFTMERLVSEVEMVYSSLIR